MKTTGSVRVQSEWTHANHDIGYPALGAEGDRVRLPEPQVFAEDRDAESLAPRGYVRPVVLVGLVAGVELFRDSGKEGGAISKLSLTAWLSAEHRSRGAGQRVSRLSKLGEIVVSPFPCLEAGDHTRRRTRALRIGWRKGYVQCSDLMRFAYGYPILMKPNGRKRRAAAHRSPPPTFLEHIPFYYQLKETFLSQLRRGLFKVGDKIPVPVNKSILLTWTELRSLERCHPSLTG